MKKGKLFIRKIGVNIVQKIVMFFSDKILINIIAPLPKRQFVIGVTEVANNIYMLKKVLPDSYSVCFHLNQYYLNNSYDFILPNKKFYRLLYHYLYKPFLLCRLAQAVETFIYIWTDSFCEDRERDFKYLKRKNKKLITIFVGSDIRSSKKLKEYIEEKEYDSFIYYLPPEKIQNEEENRRRAEMTERYADMIITANVDQPSYFIGPTFPFLYYIDTSEYGSINYAKYEDTQTVKIVHFPTSSIIKGTQLVRAAIKKLKVEGYVFEYIEGNNIQHFELIQILKEAHIVLNQFYSFVPGTFGIEALFSYSAVLMSADPDLESFPEQPDNAWILTRYWEVYDNLKFCLDNPKQLEGFARRGHSYAMRNYTLDAARKQFISYCSKTDIPFTDNRIKLYNEYKKAPTTVSK